MKKMHRIVCLIMTLCLLLCTAGGCAAPAAPDSTSQPDSSSVDAAISQEGPVEEKEEEIKEEQEQAPAPEEPTQPEAVPMDLLAGQLHLWDAAQVTVDTLSYFDRDGFGYYFTLTDRYLYVMGNSLQSTPGEPISCMLQITLTDSSITEVPLPALKSEDSYFKGFDVDADGNLHLLETESIRHDEGGYSFSHILHTVAPDGSVLASHALDLATDVSIRQDAVVCLPDGSRALFTSQKGLLLVSPQGSCRSVSIKAAWNRIHSISMAGDLLLVLYTGSDNWVDQLLLWDTAAGRELRTLTLPEELTTVGGALEGRLPPTVFGDENGGIWLHNEDGLYAIDDRTGKGTLLCSWFNSDITYSQLNELICAVGNGSFVGIGNGGAEKGLLITALTPRSPTDTTYTTTLTLGGIDLREIRHYVQRFNQEQDEILIQLRDYSTGGHTQAELSARLDEDANAGSMPDILLNTDKNLFSRYAAQGLFADLYPMLDADEQLSRQDLWTGPLTAGETDGKLTSIIPSFYILTLAGAADVVGPDQSWTWQNYLDLLAADPDFVGMGSSIVTTALELCEERFVDTATGSCSLDGEEFVALLEQQAAVQPDFADGSWYDQHPRNQLEKVQLADFAGIRQMTERYGEAVAFKGFPTADGTDGSTLAPQLQLAIADSSTNKQAAWQFIRWLLEQEDLRGYPLRRDLCQARADAATQQPTPQWHETGNEPHLRPTTQAELEQLFALLENTDTAGRTLEDNVYGYSRDMSRIIADSIKLLYAGKLTAQQAASAIQKQITAYLADK